MNKIKFMKVLSLTNYQLTKAAILELSKSNKGNTLILTRDEKIKESIGDRIGLNIVVTQPFFNDSDFIKFIQDIKKEYEFSNLIICDPLMIRPTFKETIHIKRIELKEWVQGFDLFDVTIVHDIKQPSEPIKYTKIK